MSNGESDDEGWGLNRVVGRAVGSVVSPIVESVDVDEVLKSVDVDDVVRRIDVNDVVQRVDIDALLDRVDVDRMLDRVDVERLLERIDMDRMLDGVDVQKLVDRIDPDKLLERVDVNELVDRTELGAIIARSTSGVFTQLLDVVRTQIVTVDQVVQGVAGAVLRGRTRQLPPAPPLDDTPQERTPSGATDRAIAVQGRFAGSVSRFLSFLLDSGIIAVLFALGGALVQAAVRVVIDDSFELDQAGLPVVIFYAAWSFIYYASSLAATGRTIGKAILGVMVVQADGSKLRGRQAALRTLVFPLSFLLLGIGLLIGLFRSDRRELHDLIAGTAVIYAWDAETAQLRDASLAEGEHTAPA